MSNIGGSSLSAFCFFASLRTRGSPNRTQPNFAKCWEASQICKCTLPKFGVCSP